MSSAFNSLILARSRAAQVHKMRLRANRTHHRLGLWGCSDWRPCNAKQEQCCFEVPVAKNGRRSCVHCGKFHWAIRDKIRRLTDTSSASILAVLKPTRKTSMKKTSIFAAALIAFASLSACGQQEEPVMVIEPEPVYDKYGNVAE